MVAPLEYHRFFWEGVEVEGAWGAGQPHQPEPVRLRGGLPGAERGRAGAVRQPLGLPGA